MTKMKLTLTFLRNFVIGVLLVVLGGVIGYRLGTDGAPLFPKPIYTLVNFAQPADKSEVDFAVFWEVWSLLNQDYLDNDKLDVQEMVDGAIRGLTAALGDPYTIYLSPKENKRSSEDLAGSFYGVGIELGYVDGTLAVVSPLKGTPADEAGIEAGDLILHVKDEKKNLDEDTNGWSLVEAVEKIRGRRGSTVILTLFREGTPEPFDVPVKRGEIVVESVELEFIEHDGKRVAHLKLSRFGERTMKEWDKAIKEIVSEGSSLDGVVLDLRNNPGGFFDASITIASEFVDKGIVVSQKSKYSTQNFSVDGGSRLTQMPIVVLVNRGSASASEIVAGALRDLRDAKLVGEQTFGKGTVQDRRELSNDGGIHITVGRWLLPKGDWIHDEGLPVTVEVEQDRETEEDEVLLRGIEEL